MQVFTTPIDKKKKDCAINFFVGSKGKGEEREKEEKGKTKDKSKEESCDINKIKYSFHYNKDFKQITG